MKRLETISDVSNGGQATIETGIPYVLRFTVSGVSDMLFHRWNCDSVEAKASAKKNSASKKTDDVPSYVYRDEKGFLCIPGEYFRQSIIHAAKFRQDPRSPRKSAMDLFRAGVLTTTALCSLGTKDWDYLDRRRVVVQRQGITRVRPAFRTGWIAKVDLLINTPEYISSDLLVAVFTQAGLLVGVGDFRPTFGRYCIKSWDLLG